MAWTDYNSEDYAVPLSPRRFRPYGPMDIRPYMPAINPNVDTAPSPDNEAFRDAPPPAMNPVALAPRQPGGMGARNPQADLQDQYTDVGAKLSAALQPNPVSTPRALLGAFVGSRNPQLASIITGDFQRQRAIQPLMQQEQLLGQQLNIGREMENQGYINRLHEAEASKATAEAGGVPAKMALEQAQAEAANYKEDPNLGLIDLRTKQPVSGAAAVPLTAEEADVLGKNEGDRVPLKLKNTANEIVNRGYTTVNTEQGVYEHKRGTEGPGQRLGNNPREISLDTPVGALDNTTKKQVMVTKKDIIANPGRYAPTSADVSTPVIKQTLKEYASTKPGTAGGATVAFNTAMAHLGLLNDAIDGLGNNNIKVFNSASQKYKEQTGSTVGPTFDTVKQAVSGELAKVTGSLSQGEQEAIKGPLDKANSPQALKAAVRSAIQIMDGKMGALHDHYVSVMGEEPDSPLISPEAKKVKDRLLGISVTDPQGGVHTFPDRASADKFKKLAGIK